MWRMMKYGRHTIGGISPDGISLVVPRWLPVAQVWLASTCGEPTGRAKGNTHMACKYCGRNADHRVDQYGEEECAKCAAFWSANPTPPSPAPTPTVVNLESVKSEIKKKK